MGFFIYRSWEQKLNEWGQKKDLGVYSGTDMKTGLMRWMEVQTRAEVREWGSEVLTWGVIGEGKRRWSEEGALDQESKLLGFSWS